MNIGFDTQSIVDAEGMRIALNEAFQDASAELFPMADGDEVDPIGAVVKIREGKTVLYCTRRQCTAVRFAPYERWEAFLPDLLRLWYASRGFWNGNEPSRMGLRYTNELAFDEADGPLSELLSLYPGTSGSYESSAFTSMRPRLLASAEASDGEFITEIVVSVSLAGEVRNVIIDLDVKKTFATDVSEGELDITVPLEKMHKVINAAFEATISQRLRSKIE